MKLEKKYIHMNRLKGEAAIQITLDDDYNISDSKPDADKIIKNQGSIFITEIKNSDGKVKVKGSLDFNVLYISNENGRMINSMKGRMPFEENINMDNIIAQDIINAKYELEDLSTTLVNSRKISIRALLSIACIAEEIYDEETATSVEEGEADGINCINKKLELSQIAINKKDIFRIKDELVIPSAKKNIAEILYSDVNVANTEFRPMDGQMMIKGEMQAFIIYLTDDGDFDYIEKEIPFSGNLEINGCMSYMIDNVKVTTGTKEVANKPDEDGEERIIDVEIVLDLDIKMYSEEEIEVLEDVYSLVREVTPICKDAEYERLVMKNSGKTHVSERVIVDENKPAVLQICNSSASVKIDETELMAEGINIEGAVLVDIMYISAEDDSPLNLVSTSIPFTQLAQVNNINDRCNYSITPYAMHVSAIMLGNREIEVKVAISLDTIVFEKINENIIVDINVDEVDADKLKELPGIVGYIVKPGDSLWKIAKKYHSTVNKIKEINELESEILNEGERLLVTKEVSRM